MVPGVTGHEHQSPAEGWYRDPFRAHQARWYSQGVPTALVRDGDVETHDPPPLSGGDVPEPEDLPERAASGDLRRADDAEAPPRHDEVTPAQAAWEAAAETR
jgi:hypothetical protein